MLYLPLVLAVALCALYCALIVAFRIGLSRLEPPREGVEPLTPVSVVVPMRNEAPAIDRLLAALARQDMPCHRLQIVVVDDHSTDGSAQRVARWQGAPLNLTLLALPAGSEGKKQALALGIAHAQHPLVALTDADCDPHPSWVSTLSRYHRTQRAALLVGPAVMRVHGGWFQAMQALEHAALTASTLGACGLGMPIMASGANLAFHREQLGFSPAMLNPLYPSGDDMFLLHSAKRLGRGPIAGMSSPSACTHIEPAPTLGAFLAQRARWASKAAGYRDGATVGVAALVLLFNLALLGLTLATALGLAPWPVLALCMVSKWWADLALLLPYLRAQGLAPLLRVFIPLQLMYPLYVALAAVQSQTLPVVWKGRRSR